MSQNSLPFFPLQLVAFPGEILNLHVFEPRYKELVNDCLKDVLTFIIPVYDKELLDYGSEMQVEKVVKLYPNGEMDITTKCLHAVKVLNFDQQLEGKLYAGGAVQRLKNKMDARPEQWLKLRNLAKELIATLKMEEEFDVDLMTDSFQLAHKLGLSLEQEYDMLQMQSEAQRQTYMIQHIQRALPLIVEMEKAKEKIRMNGHFQNHDPLNF